MLGTSSVLGSNKAKNLPGVVLVAYGQETMFFRCGVLKDEVTPARPLFHPQLNFFFWKQGMIRLQSTNGNICENYYPSLLH